MQATLHRREEDGEKCHGARVCPMRMRISLYSPAHFRHASSGSLCTVWRSQAPTGHPDSDPSAASRWTAALCRSSTQGSTGSARCQGKCSRSSSRCSGRSW
eukprot:6686075-Prymnesium_polylepis.1